MTTISRQSPYLHKLAKLSLWRHSHYHISCLQRSQPPFSLWRTDVCMYYTHVRTDTLPRLVYKDDILRRTNDRWIICNKAMLCMYKCHPIGWLYKAGNQWLTFTKQLMVTRTEFHNLCNYPHFSITALFIPNFFFKACNTFYYDQLTWCLFFSM